MITRTFSPDVTAAEDAETEVKQIVRKGYLQGVPRAEIEKRVQKTAKAASEKIRLPSLRNAAYRSLVALGQKELNRLVYAFGRNGALAMTAIMLARRGRLTPNAAPREGVVFRNIAERIGRLDGDYETSAAGIPKRIYSKEYMKDVRREFLRFADEQGLDPDEMPNAKVRHSLVAKAEMEVRYQAHMENIEDLRRGGHNLVVCSVHADCSDRCSRWQGRVYSLDGTSGVTLDGKNYIARRDPLFYGQLQLVMLLPEKALGAETDAYRLTFELIGLGSIVLVACLIWVFYRQVNRPVHELAQGCEQVRDGKLTFDVPPMRTSEFQLLSDGFSTMLGRIRKLIDENYRQKILVQQMELKQLHAKVNPHFLHNSLLNIRAMAQL